MRYTIGVLTICLLAGCAGSPPKPPTFKGEYRPINRPIEIKETASTQTVKPGIFDFNYEGDIVDSLEALQAVQPQIKVLPPLGNVTALPVRVNLYGTTLETALRAIGEQGGDVADVVWNTTKSQGSNQVFIRFHAPYKKPVEEKGVFTVKPEKRISSTN